VLAMEPGLEVFGEEDEFWDLRLEEVKKLKLLKCDDMSRRRSSGGEEREELGRGGEREREWEWEWERRGGQRTGRRRAGGLCCAISHGLVCGGLVCSRLSGAAGHFNRQSDDLRR
jgi:hypothetical protein